MRMKKKYWIGLRFEPQGLSRENFGFIAFRVWNPERESYNHTNFSHAMLNIVRTQC